MQCHMIPWKNLSQFVVGSSWPKQNLFPRSPMVKSSGTHFLYHTYATNVVLNYKNGGGYTFTSVQIPFLCRRTHVDQKYYRNKTKKLGGGADKTASGKRRDNNINKTHSTEKIQTDSRSQLNVLVIQYLIQHVAA